MTPLWLDGDRAAADNGGTDEYAGNRAAGLGDTEWAAGTGAAGCGTAGYGSAGYRLAAAPGSSGYAPNGPMPGSYGEGSRAAWYAQNAPTQAMNPQPGNMQAVSGQNMNAQDANMQGANTPDANAQGGRMPLYADWNGRGPVPGAMGGQVPTPKGSKGGEHALSGKTWALLAVVSLVCGLVGGVGGALAVNALTDETRRRCARAAASRCRCPEAWGSCPAAANSATGSFSSMAAQGSRTASSAVVPVAPAAAPAVPVPRTAPTAVMRPQMRATEPLSPTAIATPTAIAPPVCPLSAPIILVGLPGSRSPKSGQFPVRNRRFELEKRRFRAGELRISGYFTP